MTTQQISMLLKQVHYKGLESCEVSSEESSGRHNITRKYVYNICFSEKYLCFLNGLITVPMS